MGRRMIVSMLLLFITLTGCVNGPAIVYEFKQSPSQIKTIEIGYVETPESVFCGSFEIIKTIDQAQHQEVTEGIQQIHGQRVTPPADCFGPYILVITYNNGEKELIGNYNNGYISPEGTITLDTYCFDREKFYQFISLLIGEEIVEPFGWGV